MQEYGANPSDHERKPEFSVVIPVYNRAHIVGLSIESALGQDFADFEIIVVDDGSTDDVASVMAGFPDPRLRFVRQPNKGASAARNHGIDLARGRYVAFLDSDDSFMPGHLRQMRLLLQDRPGHVAFSPVRAQRGNVYLVRPPRPMAHGESMAMYLMCDRGFVQTSGLVVATDVAKAVRYREDVSFGDDTDFAIRLDIAGQKFVVWFDGPDPNRLSNTHLNSERIRWLDDLRPAIPRAAYLGYRGWHLAKVMFRTRPLKALSLYCCAVLHGAYSPRLAVVILAQIVVPDALYRDIADFIIGRNMRREITIRQERSA